jgi:hypothetical protein
MPSSVTLLDRPYQITPVGQKLIVHIYDSTHNSNDGFKYSLKITRTSDSVVVWEGLFDQNINGYGVIDLRPIMEPLITTTNSSIDSDNIHKSLDSNREPLTLHTIELTSGWNIDGIFTLVDSPTTYECAFWNGEITLSQGYKVNPEDIWRLNHLDNSAPKQILSNRRANLSNRYQIPTAESWDIVRTCGSDDWGVISFVAHQNSLESDTFYDNHNPVQVTCMIYDSSHSILDTIPISLGGGANVALQHFGAYPQNLNAMEITLGDWAYYSLQIMEDNGSDPPRPYPIRPKHWFYREECETRFDKVRLGWLNSFGGWDYFNFTKKNELTTQVERKRIKNILGDYSTAGGVFTMDVGIGETQEITVDSKLFMEVNTGWIDEYDFDFLSSLIRSKRVHIVKLDGSFIPVLVEDNQWVHQRIRSAKKLKGTIKLQLANGWQQM